MPMVYSGILRARLLPLLGSVSRRQARIGKQHTGLVPSPRRVGDRVSKISLAAGGEPNWLACSVARA